MPSHGGVMPRLAQSARKVTMARVPEQSSTHMPAPQTRHIGWPLRITTSVVGSLRTSICLVLVA
jgi:hypothetical protein